MYTFKSTTTKRTICEEHFPHTDKGVAEAVRAFNDAVAAYKSIPAKLRKPTTMAVYNDALKTPLRYIELT